MQECINRTRQRVWSQPPKGFLAEAYVNVDGTIDGTLGECRGGLDMSYKGGWGYAPLIVSLANTKEVRVHPRSLFLTAILGSTHHSRAPPLSGWPLANPEGIEGA